MRGGGTMANLGDTTSLIHKLTMLYLDKQNDINNLSPEELIEKYCDVYSKIKKVKEKVSTENIKKIF